MVRPWREGQPCKGEVPGSLELPSNCWPACRNCIDRLRIPPVRVASVEQFTTVGDQPLNQNLDISVAGRKSFSQNGRAAEASGQKPQQALPYSQRFAPEQLFLRVAWPQLWTVLSLGPGDYVASREDLSRVAKLLSKAL